MNLRKLNHLLAVLETRNLRAAAEAVHLSQPALSRSLQSLEDEVGIPLLDRAYGKVTPASYSEPVVDHIRRLVSEARALKESVRRIKGLEKGEIRVGFGPFAAATVLPPVASELIKRHPKLSLRLELANSPLLIELLLQGRLDLVVCDSRYVREEDALSIIRLPKQRMAFVVGRHNPLCQRKGLSLEDLNGHPIGSPTLLPEMTAAFRSRGFTEVPTVACDQIRVLLHLAANTSLVAIVPELLLESEPAAVESLVALQIKVPFDPFSDPCILHDRGRLLGPAATLLVRLIQEECASPAPTRARKRARGKTVGQRRPAYAK